jgi:ABC-type transport system involved in cytochrome c biogenesis permease subunit
MTRISDLFGNWGNWGNWLAAFLLAASLLGFSGWEQDASLSAFRALPVAESGRIKPLDSLARILLREMTGEESFQGRQAILWLADALFAPERVLPAKLFRIREARLPAMLGLPGRDDLRYSFIELAGAFDARGDWLRQLAGKRETSAQERELLRLFGAWQHLRQVTGSLILLRPLIPLDAEMARDFGLPGREREQGTGRETTLDYLQALRLKPALMQALEETARRKPRLEDYTPEEQKKALLAFTLDRFAQEGRGNALMRLIPPGWEGENHWLSPWMVVETGRESPASLRLFDRWRKLMKDWRGDDTARFRQESEALAGAMRAYKDARPASLRVEVFYHLARPLTLALFCYGIGTLLAALALKYRKVALSASARVLLATGVWLHGGALLMRMFILWRPPVSDLYESMLFVALIAAAGGMAAGWMMQGGRRRMEASLAGAMMSSLLLASARVFAGEGDTLEVLTPVLNTQFWLATHVLCITTGYGAALGTALAAQFYLARRAFARHNGEARHPTEAHSPALQTLALIALLFTATGTMLGGIWADQSWGRFWGWDPKENGALLIVLWLVWLLHGRIAGQLAPLGFALGLGALGVIVALAWVGVNLLSVGLHSYGFTDKAARGLFAFSSAQILLLAGFYVIIRRRETCVSPSSPS